MFRVRAATTNDRPEIQALIGEMIPGCDVAARWRWLYETNPGGPALTWLAEAPSGEVAGCTSFFPFRLWLDGAPVHAALGGDGYVRPAFRRRGLGALLHDASRLAMREHRIGCMYGAPGAMNLTPLKHGGSRELGHVSRWARPLRGAAMGLRAPLLDRTLGRLIQPRRPSHLEPMSPQDHRIDELWMAARDELRLSAVRDTAFYTWRFHDVPGRMAPPFVVMARGRPIGACALEPLFDGRVLRIVDVFAVPGAFHAALRAIARYATEHTGAEVLDIKMMSRDGRKRQLWRAGFAERESKPFLCMIPRDGDRRFLDADRWYYTGADSDLETVT